MRLVDFSLNPRERPLALGSREQLITKTRVQRVFDLSTPTDPAIVRYDRNSVKFIH